MTTVVTVLALGLIAVVVAWVFLGATSYRHSTHHPTAGEHHGSGAHLAGGGFDGGGAGGDGGSC